MRLNFLKEHHKIIYTNLLTSNTLNEHLQNVDAEANQLYVRLIDDYKKKRNIAEELKEKNQLKWVGEMNNIEKLCDGDHIEKYYLFFVIFNA